MYWSHIPCIILLANMAKRKRENINISILEALKKLPFPIVDKKHGLTIYLDDERARSNQTRLEHIAQAHHLLTVKDIEFIPEGIIRQSKLKKDKKRKDTFNYYFKSKGCDECFVKVSIMVNPEKRNTGKIKTIYITKTVK